MSPTNKNPNQPTRSPNIKPDQDAELEEGTDRVANPEMEDEDSEEGTATVSSDLDDDDDLDLGDQDESDADADTGVSTERESSDGKAGRQPRGGGGRDSEP